VPAAAPARITEAPRSVKVLDNSVLSLVCRASGNPVPEISWSRGGRRLLPTSPKRYTIIDITGGSVLWIKPVKARWDDGFVDCVANNEVSEPATARASIRVYTRDNGESVLFITYLLSPTTAGEAVIWSLVFVVLNVCNFVSKIASKLLQLS